MCAGRGLYSEAETRVGFIFNNYSAKVKLILLNNRLDDVEGIVQ